VAIGAHFTNWNSDDWRIDDYGVGSGVGLGRDDVIRPVIQSDNRTPPNRRARAAPLVRRAFWVLAALAHVQGIVRAVGFGETGAEWLRAGVLLVGMAFCLLKVADLAALRPKPGWRPWLVGVLALILIHVGMMPELHDSVADVWAASAMGTTALAWIRPSLAHVLKRVDRTTWDRPRLISPLVGFASEWLLPGRRLLLCRLIVTPRAPPRTA